MEIVDELAPAAPSHTLDQLAEATLARIAEFFGRSVNTGEFCGFAVDEEFDAKGLPQSLRLVACDIVDGEPVRRVAKSPAIKLASS